MGFDDPMLRVSQRIDDSEAASPSPSTSNSLPGIHEEDVDIVPHSLRYKDAFSTLPTVQAMTGRPTISSDDNSVPTSGSVLLSPSNTECCIVGKHICSQADLGTTQTLNDTVNIMRDGNRREEDSNNDSIEAVINGASPAVVNSSIAISKAHFTDKHMPMSMLSIGTRDGMDDTSEGNGFDAHDNLGQSSPLVASTSHHACAVSSPGNANARITSCLASTFPTLVAHDAGTCSSPDTMMDDDDLANGQDTAQLATSSVSGPVQPAPVLPIRGNTGSRITTEAELRPSDTVFACLYEDCRFEGMSHQHLHLDVLGHTGVEAPR
ncbi:hypothetical protein WOLCODRAFT_153093 [Wolfiporia cocos MD-104 SS10]|uniref:Uncharacterized protein n=1 Tax=Wolfiporia cocos (strain MD-104) TaxID=742152 RepID=A0A2H3JMD5_WOLCO|nr:hypothetical protein WOLCODRAFT_153093 [Wolfiporia cocos MD-104 SS10]